MCPARFLPTLALLFVIGASSAQTWMPDPAFGDDGRVTFDGFTGSDELMDLWVDDDDGILVLGWSTIFDVNVDLMVLARFTADGLLDEDFGEEGVTTANQTGGSLVGRAMERMNDGRIVVVGSVTGFPIQRDALLLHFTPEGEGDLTFGTFGRVRIDLGLNEVLMDLLVQEDGTILAAGRRDGDVLLMRVTTDGDLDDTFGVGGVLELPEGAGAPTAPVRLLRRPQGGFLLLARIPEGCMVMAFDDANAFDPDFGSGGVVFIPYAGNTNAFALAPDGGILLAGTGGTVDDSTGICLGARVDRLLSTGQPDLDFAGLGFLLDGATEVCDIFFDVLVQDDGKTLVTGTFTTDLDVGMDLAVLRYLTDGSRDASFGDNGLVQVDMGCEAIDVAFALGLQSDGGIIVGGVTNCGPFANDLALVRLYPAITTGVPATRPSGELRLFPNPTAGQAVLVWEGTGEGPVMLEVHDAMGRLVSRTQWPQAHGGGPWQAPLDTSSLAPGTYAAVLTQSSRRAVQRFVRE